MTYEPLAYWRDRAAKHGRYYVARNNDPAEYERERVEFERALEQLLPSPIRTLLDFGAGSGRFEPFLHERCDEYHATDLLRPAPLATFDVIVAIVVFQHIPDLTSIVDTIARLRPGGSLIVIDNKPLTQPAPHMFPRAPMQIARELGLTLIDVLELRDHWAGRFEAIPEPGWDKE
jgi:SAM-dependent methyltransferase